MSVEKEYYQKLNQMFEMSKAFHSNQENRLVWVENPNSYNNEYFKYFNSARLSSATKVARIKLRSAEYVQHSDYLESWVLNSKEKDQLIDLLNAPYSRDSRITNWQQIIVTYNDDFFNIDPEETIFDSYDKDAFPQALSIDMEMPNYKDL